MNILQKIFSENFEVIRYTLHPRKCELENIEKMINCGDPSYGGTMYGCPHCGNLKFVPFRCHSRFCPACGNKYATKRTTQMSFKLVDVQHRHCVFTINENLRHFFLEDRSLLDCLFHSVNSVITCMFNKINKSMNYTPGFILVLHTFGRDLKWNPHIHCLVSEGGLSGSVFWKNVSHFNYTFLRNAFRTTLLNEMEKVIGPSFKKTKPLYYKNNEHGFYVYAKPNKCDPKTVVKYIGRYLGRKNIPFSSLLMNGATASCPLLAMIPSNAQNVVLPCSFLNCISDTGVSLWKKCTRKLCPDLVGSVLLHDKNNHHSSLCLWYTLNKNKGIKVL